MASDKAIPIIVIFLIFILIVYIGDVFRKVPSLFFFLLIVCPVGAWALRSPAFDDLLTEKGYYSAQVVLISMSIGLAIIIFAHYDYLRDSVAPKYIDGYSVSYHVESDDYGRPTRAAESTAKTFYGKTVLYLSQWAIIGLCLGFPFLTWKFSVA